MRWADPQNLIPRLREYTPRPCMEARQGRLFGYLPYPTALTGPCQQTAADLVAARCLQPPITAASRRLVSELRSLTWR